VVRIGQLRETGTDVTDMMQGAWAQLLDMVDTVAPD